MKTNFDMKNIGMYCGGASFLQDFSKLTPIIGISISLLPLIAFIYFLYEGCVRIYELILKKPRKNPKNLRYSLIVFLIFLFAVVFWKAQTSFLCGNGVAF